MSVTIKLNLVKVKTVVNEGLPNNMMNGELAKNMVTEEFPNNVMNEGLSHIYPDIHSEELNRLIERDHEDYIASGALDQDGIDQFLAELVVSPAKEPPYLLPDLNSVDEDYNFLKETMVDPRTLSVVTPPFLHPYSAEMEVRMQTREPPKPYHPSQDHDYLKNDHEENCEETKKKGLFDHIDELINKDEPDVVDVWEIDSFLHKEPPAAVVPEKFSTYTICKKETRRTSTRTAEIKRREHAARNISNAVHAVLKKDKAQRRQYRNTRPKNSVETTPSQSDIEEWYSQPVRPTNTKITKKKTSKGRIDHSESERHRREVLRKNFSSLCDLIPQNYLRGEKMSSQISKQKILNGAKAYILALQSRKISYKALSRHNGTLREQCQKSMLKMHKYLKRQK